MRMLLALFIAQLAATHTNMVDRKRRQLATPSSHRFSQVSVKGGNDNDKGLLSLLFHGPVAPRHIKFGLEDSNRGVLKEIQINEDENHLETMLNRLQENEQNQVDAIQEAFYLQNAQLDQMQHFITQ